jgi:WD repeat-containing protein 68
MSHHDSNPYIPSQETGRPAGQSQHSGGLPPPLSLQPGNSSRPVPSTSNSSSSIPPLLPPISTQSAQQYQSSSRPTTGGQSHGYSRSSPAAGYGQNPDEPKYASTPSKQYMSVQTPQTGAYSPLGLADIRSGQESNADAPPNSMYDPNATPSNCNYLAPWAVYAFDWCKWPVQHHGLGDAAGKMAIGSYLEDGHNFVRLRSMLFEWTQLMEIIDSNTRHPNRARSRARKCSRSTPLRN